jgi:2-succinyl-5-enolpyruvyl-6-hydroxy-3-cyclohexene-1-carboxylate synthase
VVEIRNAGQAFAAVLVDELVRHGVRHAVVAPGSRSTPVALALAADARVSVHVRIDERSASYLAVGISRATGAPVPVLCTSGTATAHFHGAVMEADQSRLPLLVLTADRPPELRGVGANQTVDQSALYAAAVRWSCDVGVPEARADSVRYWRSLVSRAVAVSTGRSGGPGGPVHLNLPLREPLTPVDDGVGFPFPVDGRPDGAPWTASDRAPTPLPPDVVRRLGSARRGVVVAGDGLSADDVAGVTAFSQCAGWPLVAEPHSNARRGWSAMRCADAVLGSRAFTAEHRPELVLVAGRVGLSRTLLGWLGGVPHIVVDRDGVWSDPTRSAERVVRADASTLPPPDNKAPTEWHSPWLTAAAVAAAAVDKILDESDTLSEPRVARDVVSSLPGGAALVVASSMPIRDLDLVMPAQEHVRVLANRGVSGIDGFVSTAIGVALTHDDGPTVALAGDLSLLHDVNGLLADDRPDLTLVVLNNDGGGIFSLLPQASEDAATFERLFGTPHGVDLGRLAAAYDVEHLLVTSPAGLVTAVQQRTTGVRLVEVRTDRRANAELHQRLHAAAAAAVG